MIIEHKINLFLGNSNHNVDLASDIEQLIKLPQLIFSKGRESLNLPILFEPYTNIKVTSAGVTVTIGWLYRKKFEPSNIIVLVSRKTLKEAMLVAASQLIDYYENQTI